MVYVHDVCYRAHDSGEESDGQPNGGYIEACTVVTLNTQQPTPNWHDVPCAIDTVTKYACKKSLHKGA